MKTATTNKKINEVLNNCNYEVESDLVAVEYENEGVYLSAHWYFDNSIEEVTMTINDESVSLTIEQKEMILNRLYKEANNERESQNEIYRESEANADAIFETEQFINANFHAIY